MSGEEVSVVWVRHLLLKRGRRLSRNGDLLDMRQTGEYTLSVTVKVDGKNTGCGSYRL